MDTAQNRKEQPPVSGLQIPSGETGPVIPSEVAEIGARAVSAEVEFTKEHQAAGIRPAGAAVPFSTEPEGLVELPLTREEARQALKIHKDVADAFVWLARWVLRQLEKFKVQNLKGLKDAG